MASLKKVIGSLLTVDKGRHPIEGREHLVMRRAGFDDSRSANYLGAR
jgi:hypothetical protein